jgi:7-cyano-7-deazaguanine synthase in queuosine biosynthesis
MRVTLVLFSGGLDSTYLVSHMLSDDGPVDILYVNGGQCPNKIAMELEARDRLIAQMNEYYPNKIRNSYEFLLPTYRHHGDNKKWTQPNAWLQGAFSILDPELHNNVRVAYVSDDGAHFGYHLRHLEDQWLAMQKMGFKGEPVPIEFATLHMTKLDIMEGIDKRLLPNVWVCELPKDRKACGGCSPCKLANETLAKYKAKHGETVWRAVRRAQRQQSFWYTDVEKRREVNRQGDAAYVLHEHRSYKDFQCLPEEVVGEAILIET